MNAHITQGERIILPRLGDACRDGLHLRRAGPGFVECMVADFSDAFFMLPLSPKERRFVAFKAFGKYYLARVLMFGAKSSPTLWGRCAAFLARAAQCMFDDSDLLLQLFVDDTFAQARGSKQQRRIAFAAILLWWSVLGAKIAWHKGNIAPALDWIGAHIRHESQFLIVSIKEELLRSALDVVQAFLRMNVIKAAKLRSLTGKLSFISGIVPTMRPFIAELWAALAQSAARDGLRARVWAPRGNRRSRPPQTIWRKQVQHGLQWVFAFLSQTNCRLERAFLVDDRRAERWTVWCDASPYGLGAVLVRHVGHRFEMVEFLASPLCDWELGQFRLKRGDPAGQAIWEALAVVVAARTWKFKWSQSAHAELAVKSDSLAALNAARRLSSHDPNLNCVMQELALVVAVHGLRVSLIEHVPGLANVLPDALSRKYQSHHWQLPTQLRGIKERVVSWRPRSWWQASGLPAL